MKKIKSTKNIGLFLVVGLMASIMILIGCATAKPVKKSLTGDVPPQGAYQDKAISKVTKHYNVVKGDCLWDISAKSRIYNDPFAWVLIYKANRDQISDPDVIEIGQSLKIKYGNSPEEIQQAIQQAEDTPPYQKKR